MDTIVERTGADGSIAFRAQILVKSNSRIVHRQTFTFDWCSTAEAWLKNRERKLASPGGLQGVQRKTGSGADIIKDYPAGIGTSMGGTKTQVFRSIRADCMIAGSPRVGLRRKGIVDFARTLRGGARETSTVRAYFSHLTAAVSIARTARGCDLGGAAVEDGVAAARHPGLASKSRSRDRRPTLSENDSLMAHFVQTGMRDPRSLPPHRVTARDVVRQVAEVRIRVAVLNGHTALGIPVTKAAAQVCPV